MWYSELSADVIIVGLLIVITLMLARSFRQPRSFTSDPVLKEEIKRTPPPLKPGDCIRCGSAIYPGQDPAHPTARIYCGCEKR